MAKLNINQQVFATTEANKPLEPIPAGTYPAQIIESDYRENKNGTGMLLELTYQVIDGEQKGRKFKQFLNLEHSNQDAVRIAYSELAAITDCLGLPRTLEDSAALHGKPLYAVIAIDGTYNRVKGVKSMGHQAPAMSAASVQAAQAGRPWEQQR